MAIDLFGLLNRRSEDKDGNPISRFGDRVGRRVAGWVNDRVGGNSDRAYDRYMEDMYAQERPPLLANTSIRGTPDSLRSQIQEQGPPSSMAQPWQRTNYSVEPRNGPTVNGRQMTQSEYDRYRNDSRSILNERAGRDNPMDAIDRGPLTSYVDRSAATRSGTGTSSAYARAMEAINARGIGANMIK